MAGPWEDYQRPAPKAGAEKGPWMDYEEPVAPVAEAIPSRTWGQVAKEAPTHVVQSFGNLLSGLWETAKSVPGAAFAIGEAVNNPAKQVELGRKIIDLSKAIGGAYAQRYGSEQALKNTMATDPVGFLADVSTLFTGVGAAATRAGATGTGRVLTTTARRIDPLRPVIAPIEYAATGATNIAEKGMRGGKANVLLEATEGRAPQIINALRGQTEIVPGSLPTAGEAAAGVGSTRFAALQESAEKVMPTPYSDRQLAQDVARVQAIRQFGQDEAALKAAKQARDATATTLYGKAGVQPIQVDATLQSLLDRPSMKAAVQRAQKLAAEDGITWGVGGYTAADAHYVKLALDDLIRDPATFGIGKVEAAKIGGTRKEFIKWLEGQVPDYGTARSTFQAQSQPINQMEVGQYLESRLTTALQGETTLRPGVFAGAIEAAPQTIKKATTGASPYQKLEQILTPDQLKAVNAVRDDLAREARQRTLAARGRPAGPSAEDAYTAQMLEMAGGVQMPTLLNRVATVANAIIRRAAGKLDRKLAIEIATDMLDPKRTATAIEVAQRRAASVEAGLAPVRAAGRAVVRGATPAAAVGNALTQSQNQNALLEQ